MFWGVTLENGKKYESVVDQTYHVSMAATEPSQNAEPVSLYVKTDAVEGEFLVCTLDGKNTRQVPLDLLFVEGTEVTFHIKGNGKIHLTGYLAPEDDGFEFDEEDEEDSEDDVSDEEITRLQAIGQKRGPGQPVPSNAVPSKKSKTQESPALKAAANGKAALNGKATSKAQTESDEDDDDDESDDGEDDDSADVELAKMLAGLKKARAGGAGDMSVDEDDDDDEDEEDDDEEEEDEDEEEEEEQKIMDAKKKMKEDLKKPQSKPQQQQQAQKPQQQNQQQQKQKQGQNITPRPGFNQNKNKPGTPFGNKNTPQGGRSPFNKQQAGNSSFGKKNKGFSVEDLVPGHGPVATKGRLVTVSYVGRLASNGQEFDRSKEFSFRLGKGEVIKGWDLGLDKARVGSKKRIYVPAHMAYGNKRTGPIPANSDLSFEVEVKRVS